MSTNQSLLSHRQSCDFHELESRFSTQSALSLKKMTPETPLGSESPSLCVTYKSPSNASFTHTMSLSALPQTTAQKTAYLAALRQATAQMQEVINKELTERMEEDNKKAAAAGDGGVNGENGKVDEKMEENYGEEFVEDN
ncbi:unnamed protein product [Diplocarpon coronariae]|uniref:EKC/KEOPS complex subunit GON7 n=1 Tax=Diplocarpon coronariae TaxID=2795749 RepID=A0A218Z2T5_9HELO|nr:hypothetical protein B2J93_3157 [Marssonina coronariae]